MTFGINKFIKDKRQMQALAGVYLLLPVIRTAHRRLNKQLKKHRFIEVHFLFDDKHG